MLAWFVIVVGSAFSGTLALSGLGLFGERVLVLASGTLVGLTVLTTASYAVSLSGIPAGVAHGVVLGAMVLIVLFPGVKGRALIHWRTCGFDRFAAALWGTAFIFYAPIGKKLLFGKDGGLWTGVISAYGDVAWHVSNLTSFSQGQTFPPENPIFAGTALVYPFLVNYLSGGLVSLGASMATAINGPAVILIPLLFTLYYLLVRELTGRRKVALLAVLLLMGGGAFLGWTRIFSDYHRSVQGPLDFLLHLPARDYSGVGADADGFDFVNPVTTLLLPQRAFLFGMPLAFLICLLWIRGVGRKSAFVAGSLMGMLPLFHTHTALALVPALILGTPRERWRDAPAALIPAAVLGLPEIAYFLRFGTLASHLSIHLGWLIGKANPIWYWFKNTGFVFPLALLAQRSSLPTAVKRLAMAGLVLFAFANVFQVARWAWDNYKIFIYAWLFCVPAAAYFAVYFTDKYRKAWVRGVVTLLVVCHLIAGGLDTWKIWLPTAPAYGEWGPEALAVATRIRLETPVGSRFVHAPIHNSPVSLAGRLSYLGYAAHVWSHGGEPWRREAAIKELFTGVISALPERSVDFALVGPVERRSYPTLQIPGSWSLVFRSGPYVLYRLSVSR